MRVKVNYFSDELHDDFAGNNIKTVQTPSDFKYVHKNAFWRGAEFVVYRLLAMPLVALISQAFYHTKYVGRHKAKKVKGGIFTYANHVTTVGDAFHPNVAFRHRKTYIMVHPDATSIPGIKNLVVMLGGMPMPSGLAGYRNFLGAVKTRIREGSNVTIYPEAHLWPMYTGIRPFSDDSFLYPVTMCAPIFASTTVLKKRRFSRRPKCVVYIDGPFFPDESLPVQDRKTALRDVVYQTMCERAKASNYDKVCYEKVPVGDERAGTSKYVKI